MGIIDGIGLWCDLAIDEGDGSDDCIWSWDYESRRRELGQLALQITIEVKTFDLLLPGMRS